MTYTFKLARRMASNHVALAALTAVLASALTACGDGTPTGPTPPPSAPAPMAGWLTVELDTPHDNDGAVQLTVMGPPIEAISVTAPYQGVSIVDDGVGHLVVMGAITDGPIARVRVPDANQANQYVLTVQAAAARTTFLPQETRAYRGIMVR